MLVRDSQAFLDFFLLSIHNNRQSIACGTVDLHGASVSEARLCNLQENVLDVVSFASGAFELNNHKNFSSPSIMLKPSSSSQLAGIFRVHPRKGQDPNDRA